MGTAQAVDQGADAQDAFAHLAHAKHQADRHAVFVQMRVDRSRGRAAGFELGTELLQGVLQSDLACVGFIGWRRQRGDKTSAQMVEVGRQRMEWRAFAGRCTHAQTQFGRKARGPNLAGTDGDGFQQRQLPVTRFRTGLAGGARHRLQQGHDPGQHVFVQRQQPLRVETVRQHQRKQFGCVHRLGRGGQQLQAHALREFADEGIARREAVVRQQHRHVQCLVQCEPPAP